MGLREQRHARGRLRAFVSWLPELLVLLLVVGALANLRFDLGRRWFGLTPSRVGDQPAQVLPPEGLELPADTVAEAVAGAAPGGPLAASAVRRAVAPYIGAAKLGSELDVAVSELGSGRVVYRHGTGAVTPASTNKLLTATAALQVLGPMARFSTTVRRSGDRIVLVGGGDPFLASTPAAAKGLYPARANLGTLAEQAAAALTAQGVTTVGLGYDDSLFTGPQVSPDWPASYVTGNVVPPITALWVDEGRDRNDHYVADPARAAAEVFAQALAAHGVTVRGPVERRVSTSADTEIASTQSAPLGQIVEHTLAVSDNNAAEVLSHQVGLAVGHDASFAGGVAAVRTVLSRLGIDTTGSSVYDGSGLSRRDRLTPDVLLRILEVVSSAEHPRLRQVITGLPVAGFSGSLQWRFDDASAGARGRVRAKTGTLSGVTGLAGIITDAEGNRMAFVAIADRVGVLDTMAARHAVDLIAGSLAACSCGRVS